MALGESGEIKAKSEKSEERLEEVDDLVRVLREKLAEHSKDKNELTLQVTLKYILWFYCTILNSTRKVYI